MLTKDVVELKIARLEREQRALPPKDRCNHDDGFAVDRDGLIINCRECELNRKIRELRRLL